MTEGEAKAKWCPFSRGPNGDNRDNPENGKVVATGPCIGSACMAWRVAEPPASATIRLTARQDPNDPNNSIIESVPIPASDMHGYCGLAGKL